MIFNYMTMKYQVVNESVNKFAFSWLLKKARAQSKCEGIVNNLKSDTLKIQCYLLSDSFSKEEVQLLFQLRSRSFPVKSNMKTQFVNDMKCRVCLKSFENEIHLARDCEMFTEERGINDLYVEDIFGPTQMQIKFIQVFKIIARKWKLLLEIEDNN